MLYESQVYCNGLAIAAANRFALGCTVLRINVFYYHLWQLNNIHSGEQSHWDCNEICFNFSLTNNCTGFDVDWF